MIAERAIRHARPDDAEAIARVHVETWRSTYAGLVPDHYLLGMSVQGQALRWKKLLRRLPRGQGVLVAATPDGAVVGFGSWAPARNRPPPASGEIQTLYVAVDWQGRGLGAALLANLLRALATEGHADAYLWVLAENPARFFYERQGGQRAAEQVEHFAGTQLLEYAYRWAGLAR